MKLFETSAINESNTEDAFVKIVKDLIKIANDDKNIDKEAD